MSDSEQEEANSVAISIQIVLLAIIFVTAVVGNGLVCFVVNRFKHLRTIPNIFIVNLSVIDLCNALINMPLFTGYYIIKADIFTGKWISSVCLSLHNCMICLNVLALFVLMADRYGAVKFELRYHTWKTKLKAYLVVALIWVSGAVLIVDSGFRHHKILAANESLTLVEYLRILYKTEGWRAALGIFGVPFVGIVVLGLLVCRAVQTNRRRIEAITREDGCTAQGKQMLSMLGMKETQTFWTIIIIVVAYTVCFFPALILGQLLKRGIESPWVEYFAFFFTFFSSASNPVVYSLRTCRFREVVKKLFERKPRGEVITINPK